MICRIEDEIESGFDVGGRERAAIVEVDAAAKVEDVGERVRSIPSFGEIAVEIHLVVAFEEAAEEQAVDVLGLRVGGEAGIEIRGIGFDEEGKGSRIRGGARRTAHKAKGSNEIKK